MSCLHRSCSRCNGRARLELDSKGSNHHHHQTKECEWNRERENSTLVNGVRGERRGENPRDTERDGEIREEKRQPCVHSAAMACFSLVAIIFTPLSLLFSLGSFCMILHHASMLANENTLSCLHYRLDFSQHQIKHTLSLLFTNILLITGFFPNSQRKTLNPVNKSAKERIAHLFRHTICPVGRSCTMR